MSFYSRAWKFHMHEINIVPGYTGPVLIYSPLRSLHISCLLIFKNTMMSGLTTHVFNSRIFF